MYNWNKLEGPPKFKFTEMPTNNFSFGCYISNVGVFSRHGLPVLDWYGNEEVSVAIWERGQGSKHCELWWNLVEDIQGPLSARGIDVNYCLPSTPPDLR